MSQSGLRSGWLDAKMKGQKSKPNTKSKSKTEIENAQAGSSAASGNGSRMQLDDILLHSSAIAKDKVKNADAEGEEEVRPRKKVKSQLDVTAILESKHSTGLHDSIEKANIEAKGSKVKSDFQESRATGKSKSKGEVKSKGNSMTALDLLTTSVNSSSHSTWKLAMQTKSSLENLSSPTFSTNNNNSSPLNIVLTTTSSTASLPSSSTHTKSIQLQTDIAILVKNFKVSFRKLSSTLETLQTETRLIHQLWYKNVWQFQSALWWACFNSVRRTLNHLLYPDSSMSSQTIIKNLALLYSGLGGGMLAFTSLSTKLSATDHSEQVVKITLPKFDTKPTSDSLNSFLSSPQAITLLNQTLIQLNQMQTILLELTKRTFTAGNVLVKHLNTPPAPTFAPLVSALLALIASVDNAANSVLAPDITSHTKPVTSNLEQHAPIQALRHIVEQVLAAAPQ